MEHEEIELMKIQRLDRIADALERIAGAADAVKSCISESGEFINIGGEVSVDRTMDPALEDYDWSD